MVYKKHSYRLIHPSEWKKNISCKIPKYELVFINFKNCGKNCQINHAKILKKKSSKKLCKNRGKSNTSLQCENIKIDLMFSA